MIIAWFNALSRTHHQWSCAIVLLSVMLTTISATKLGVYMVRSPESTIAPQGDEVQFECELNLNPEKLEWRFRPAGSLGERKSDFIYLSQEHGHNVSTMGGVSKLRVYVMRQTVGEYQCIAWYGASALASLPAKLTLASITAESSHGRPPVEVVQWKVSQGNSVIIKCGEVTSFPAPVWSFYKNNVSVPSSVPQLPSGALILSPVTQRDSGSYLCSAMNSITGTEVRAPLRTNLVVDFEPRGPPSFLTSVPTTYSAKPGSSIILECPGVSNPIPKPVWSRPDANVYNNRTKVLPYGLQIVDIIPADQGMYICRLDNGISPPLTHKMELTVLQSPIILEPPKATLTNESDRLELECLAQGSPSPSLYWMVNGDYTSWDPLITTQGSKIYIKSVEKRHAGIVQCFAKNEVGEATGSNLLQVNPKQIPGEPGSLPLGYVPQTSKADVSHGKTQKGRKKHKHPIMIPPTKPSVTRLTDESVMVRWVVPINEGLPIQFFKVQYRMLGDPARRIQRSPWMTANEDIPPHVCSYELTGLEPDRYYRFRIAAVYSNNDNKLGNTSGKFHLQRGANLGPARSHLPSPILTEIEPISETEIQLHWQLPHYPPNPVDGFYAYYRPASTAGEYSKATVDTMAARSFLIDHLEPGTAYEFKLQSFTSSAASDFSAILTGKTLKPPTPSPNTPTVITASESTQSSKLELLPLIAAVAGGGAVLLLVFILGCVALKKRKKARDDDETENKTPPDRIQVEPNGFVNGGSRVLGSPLQKASRMNGVVPRMNITPNPLAQDGDKNRNIMELRFLPSSMIGIPSTPSPPAITEILPPLPHRRTLERSLRNLNGGVSSGGGDSAKAMMDGDCGVPPMRTSSMRRQRQGSGSTPGSPQIVRDPSTEIINHSRSPMPIRAGIKRTARLGNMSNGSLNSIEV